VEKPFRPVALVPAYQAEASVAAVVVGIKASVPRVVVVDDGSTDLTGSEAGRAGAEVVRVAENEGKGAALRAGLARVLATDATHVAFLDADGQHDPADLPRLLAPLMTEADLVLGSRYVAGGGTVGWPWHRKLISRGGTTFARLVLWLPYRDLTGGFKAWRRDLLEAIRLRESNASGYGFQVETTWWAHRRGAAIREVPIVFRERTAGSSKMRGGIVLEAFALVLRRLRHS